MSLFSLRYPVAILVCGIIMLWTAGPARVYAKKEMAADSSFLQSIVVIEGLDSAGEVVSRGSGILLKKGYVATNYHFAAGMHAVNVLKQHESRVYPVNGFLTVEEEKDLIILSVPDIDGVHARLAITDKLTEGLEVRLVETMYGRLIKVMTAKINGQKDIMDTRFFQAASPPSKECTSGPVFSGNEVVGFAMAGYTDRKFYTYVLPISELVRIQNRSFIIKDMLSLTSAQRMKNSDFQTSLIANLQSILWTDLDNAVKMAQLRGRKVILDVYTNWCGWCKVMDQNTWNKAHIIRYVNENYSAVKLDAETRETISFKGKDYHFESGLHNNQLAWSLLNGVMEFPSTVFMDEKGSVLTVIPGYMDAAKMEVVLHYFAEDAYRTPGMTFQQYEAAFRARKSD